MFSRYSIDPLMTVTFITYRNGIIRNGEQMETVTTRIPQNDWEWLKEMETETGAQRSEVLRRLIDKGLREWRKEKAINLLRKNKVTLRKAAEIAGVTYIEILELLSSEDIPLGYDEKELEKDLERF